MPSSSSVSEPATRPYVCSTCGKALARLEHLQRHRKTHLGRRPHACRFCEQRFTRKDAVQRHEQARHRPNGDSEQLPAMRRACLACSAARVSCSGGVPCALCAAKDRQCIYVRRQRKRTQRPASTQSIVGDVDSLRWSTLDNDDDECPSPTQLVRDIPPEASFHAPLTATFEAPLDTLFASSNGIESRRDVALQAATGSIAQSGYTKRLDAHFVEQSEPAESAQTAMNWLPFDYDLLGQPSPADVSSNPGSSHSPNNAAGGSLTDNSPSEREVGTPNLDSLASLIASMGRASRPFANKQASAAGAGACEHPIGSLYSSGTGSRTSQAERAVYGQRAQRDKPHSTTSVAGVPALSPDFSWIETLEHHLQATPGPEDDHRQYRIPHAIYCDLMAKIDARQRFTSSSSTFSLSSQGFPNKSTVDTFVRSYFDHFHPVYPFLDLPLLNLPLGGWSLCLATAAIGCRYLSCPEKDVCADALSVVLRETLMQELQFGQAELTLSYAQALLLNALALCQSENTSVMALGEEAISSVMSLCRRFCLLDEPAGQIEQSMQICGDFNQMWTAWRCRETRRRTGIFAWMLDSALAFTRSTTPVLNVQMLNLLLPCDEKLWEADSAIAWHQAYKPQNPLMPEAADVGAEEKSRSSFRSTMMSLYENLRLVNGISQFASIGCIYALFHRHWDMSRHFQGPFALPDAQWADKMFLDPAIMCYPASIPAFTLWRNKACDYLDVLHWDALGTSAKAGGLEGPIFLQLHLARLLLLTPVNELLVLVEDATPLEAVVQLPHNVAWQRLDPKQCQQVILMWAQRDRYKARLAVVHAGAVLWHVRRYATDSFVQPFTVYLAAIVLYYFARISAMRYLDPQARNATESQCYEGLEGHRHDAAAQTDLAGVESHFRDRPETAARWSVSKKPFDHRKDPRMPASFLIDRPVDDELVQYFVRNGESALRLAAEAIDDLCTFQGAKQILLEAAMLLEADNVVWSIARKYATILRAISDKGKNHSSI